MTGLQQIQWNNRITAAQNEVIIEAAMKRVDDNRWPTVLVAVPDRRNAAGKTIPYSYKTKQVPAILLHEKDGVFVFLCKKKGLVTCHKAYGDSIEYKYADFAKRYSDHSLYLLYAEEAMAELEKLVNK